MSEILKRLEMAHGKRVKLCYRCGERITVGQPWDSHEKFCLQRAIDSDRSTAPQRNPPARVCAG